jgi:hypothetical protein
MNIDKLNRTRAGWLPGCNKLRPLRDVVPLYARSNEERHVGVLIYYTLATTPRMSTIICPHL